MTKKTKAALAVTAALAFGGVAPIVPQYDRCPHAYLQASFDTPDGFLSPGQYGRDPDGFRYWIYPIDGKSITDILEVPIKVADTKGLTEVNYTGQRARKDCIAEDKVETFDITGAEYQDAVKSTIAPHMKLTSLLTPLEVSASSPSFIGSSDTGALTGGVTVSSDSFTVTVASSGSNEMWLGFLYTGSGALPTTSTLAGNAMTLVNDSGTQQNVTQFYIINPTVGSQTWTVNYGGNGSLRNYRGVTVQDVKQSTPKDVSSTGVCTSCTAISKNITTTVNNDLVVAVSYKMGAANIANTWSATDFLVDNTINVGISYKEQTTAGLITPSYSWTSAGSVEIVNVAYEYQAPTPTGSVKIPDIINW